MSTHKEETGNKMKSLLRRGSGRKPAEDVPEKQEDAGQPARSSAGPIYPFDSEKKRKSMWLQKEQVDKLKAIASERGYKGMAHLIIDTFDLNAGR